MELHPSLFTTSLSECVFEGSLGGDPGGHNVTVSRATLGYQSHSQHHVTLKGGELCSGSVPLKRLMLIHSVPPPFFCRASFLMSQLFVSALGAAVSLSSAGDVDVLGAGTVLSFFTFSQHKQEGEGRARAWRRWEQAAH